MVTLKRAVHGMEKMSKVLMAENLNDYQRESAADRVKVHASEAAAAALDAADILRAMKKDVAGFLKKART